MICRGMPLVLDWDGEGDITPVIVDSGLKLVECGREDDGGRKCVPVVDSSD